MFLDLRERNTEFIFILHAETGTRWKDYILVTLLLSAIIGCWYAYQQNKNAKRHLRRMAKDMEGLQKAENALTEMQKVSHCCFICNKMCNMKSKR